jgi:hypothetical protein
MEAQALLLEQASPAVDFQLLPNNSLPLLRLLLLAQFPATITSAPLSIAPILVAACRQLEGGADWLIGVSSDRHFILPLDTETADANAVQLIGLLGDRVVYASGASLGTVSQLTDEPLSSLECQPHQFSAIKHLITGIT